MVNKFLFLAYAFVWLIFILYAWNLSRRQAGLKKDLDELKNKVSESSSTTASRGSAP
ncbi:MAG TPA: CcmD family protein [Terriglobia bacterium]|nr:CcmD family protein [Terriglobia bacterium]